MTSDSSGSPKTVPETERGTVSGTLYVIATPIGNLADITLRALEIFKNINVLLAEDTRVTKKLLDHYGIQANLESLHDFNESKKISSILERLATGLNMGLVSDAGTPLISDPGFKLVSAVKQAGHAVCPIPGACALTAALSAAGIATNRFVFEGFLPKSANERLKHLHHLRYEARSMVFYESPKRIVACIQSCIEVFGPHRKAALLRELTKQYEQHLHGELVAIQQSLHLHPESVRGEYVLVIQGDCSSDTAENLEKAKLLLTELQQHMSHKDAVGITAKHTGLARNKLYALSLDCNVKMDRDA